MILANLAKDH